MRRSRLLIATWLLERFVVEGRKSLVGDLEEQYNEGRSRFWYWRQTMAAIALGTLSTFRNDKLLPIRAIVSGMTAKIAWSWLFSGFAGSVNWGLPEGEVIPYIILALSGAGVAGSAVSRKRMANRPGGLPILGPAGRVLLMRRSIDPGSVGPMVLCWAAAWLTWTVAHAVITHTTWNAVHSLAQSLCIVTAGILVPVKSPDDHDELITLRL